MAEPRRQPRPRLLALLLLLLLLTCASRARAASLPRSPARQDEPGADPPASADAAAPAAGDGAAPASADGDAPASGDGDAPASGDGDAPASGDGDAPASGDGDAPASGDANAPASGDANAPTSGDANAPASGDANAPASGDANAPASGDADAPTSGDGQAGAGTDGNSPATSGDAGADAGADGDASGPDKSPVDPRSSDPDAQPAAGEPGEADGSPAKPDDAAKEDPAPEAAPVNGTEPAPVNGTEPASADADPPTDAAQAAALEHFQLLQVEEVSGPESMKSTVIFKDGALTGSFESNPKTSDIASLGAEDSHEGWYADDPYTDRISFRFAYSENVTDYSITAPVVRVSDESSITPTVEMFTNDAEENRGSFYVLYRCSSTGPEGNFISLHFQITKDHSVDTIWRKTCGRGRNEHVNFGFEDGDGNPNLFNEDGTYGTTEAQTLEVGPMQQSTELTAKLTEPQWNLDFLNPYLTSDNEMVKVGLRSTIGGGRLSTEEWKKFSVIYSQCDQVTAKATIRLTFAIPPWQNVTATWRKTCGGSHATSLLIGTTGKGSFEVMQAGELTPEYNVTDSTNFDSAFGRIEEVDERTAYKRFYLTNSDGDSDIHIQTIATTATKQDVVNAYVDVPFGGSDSYIPASGATISRHETKSLRLHFICKQVGASLILVTLPIVKYKNVEFGFIKHCVEPKVYHHSGFMQTAGSIMWTVMLLAAVSAVGSWIYMRRRNGMKYAPVPTNDRGP